MHYCYGDDDGLKSGSFIQTYVSDPRLSIVSPYSKFGVYPGSLQTPPKVFNLWTPFAIEGV
eukprot:1541552-Prymnesium_polylepis.1